MIRKTMPPLGWLAGTTYSLGLLVGRTTTKTRLLNAQLQFLCTGRFKKKVKTRLPRKKLKLKKHE